MFPRCSVLATLPFAILFLTPSLKAQECAGFPAGVSGSASYGVVGTDGASGDVFAASVREGRAGFRLERSRLEMFAFADDMTIWNGTVTWEPSERRSWACVAGGAEWTGYSADRHSATRWSESGRRTEEIFEVGDYDRLRIPLGLAVGRELSRDGSFSVITFAGTALVYERESLAPRDEPAVTRSGVALAAHGGVTLRLFRLMLRSEVGNVFTENDALSGRNNFPFASLRVGLAF